MKFLEMLAISVLIFILGISFILAVYFSVEALCYG
ncbi:hypothetical protein G177_gp19 [Helicobacter phage KHP40]|uniref:Uncharacterized protein n=1 Tax=Helicobacter phage KHP40 TaxID=1204178 RepID=I7H0J1_9CAUD|nr:hypothetical protein G177_gp19 [Helicobacter phage KHP40]BAM34791.1 hypothetical protein [Helicobacter phage KHP40]